MNTQIRAILLVCLLGTFTSQALAEPNSLGQSGLIHMPDGRVEDDGTLRLGASYMQPYSAIWGSITILPRLEFSGRYTRTEDVTAFGGRTGFGAHKDKAFDLKLLLLDEGGWWPSVSIGYQDFHGTSLFAGRYIAASKRFGTDALGEFDFTLGYGDKRFDGAFGGVRWHTPWSKRLALVAEYDSYDYENDFFARRSGQPLMRDGGFSYGAEVGFMDFFTLQVARQDDRWGANLSMALPLQQRTIGAKTDEPAPRPVQLDQYPAADAWREAPESLAPLYRTLWWEGFSGVEVSVEGDTIHAAAAHSRITTIGRAAGRAARIIALHAPRELTRLEFTILESRQPMVTYRFDDLEALRGWLEGRTAPAELEATLSVRYADADEFKRLRTNSPVWTEVIGEPEAFEFQVSRGPWFGGSPFFIYTNQPNSPLLRIQPLRLDFMFNDPNGAFKFGAFTQVSLSNWFGDSGWFGTISGRVTLWENISDTIGSSNSLLPRVRSNAPRYLRDGKTVRLTSAYLAHIGNPAERVYTVVAGGILEEMFAGAGGEVLYLPETGNWAVDVSAYAVKQRDFEGRLGFLDYETVTALVSHHYRVPEHGLTFTTRFGRFLAEDVGVRFEVKRRFLSHFEVGAWYSYTDAKDITSPGSPGNPYRDKGVFLRYAIGAFTPRDSNAYAHFQMRPWARDPGQMLRAPGNLYDRFERRLLLNLKELDAWSDFGQ